MGNALARYLVIENEDDLTRIVFGILEMLGPSVLAEVLELPRQTFSNHVTVEFHERINPRADRVPDVLIEDSDATVLIEAKRGTDFDPNQLRDEHEDLRQFGTSNKRLLLITEHNSLPSRLDEIDLEFMDWLGWSDIALRISQCDDSEFSETQYRLVKLLQMVLEEEGYLPFTGFSDELIQEFPDAWDFFERYRRHIARLHRDIESRLADTELQAKNMWRDGISQNFNRFPAELQFVSRHLWNAYGEADFTINSKEQHYLFVAFCVNSREMPIVRVGYSLSPKQTSEHREVLIDNANEIVEFITETDSHLLHTNWNFHVIERFEDSAEMTSVLNATDALSNLDRVQIAMEYDSESLTQAEVAKHIADTLIEFHEFTHPRLYP